VKLVMTLLVRNEADVVEAWLSYHLHAGVDLVIATDNRSTDGTTEILERYAREGFVQLIREERDDMRQDEWVTRMARLAATDHGAGWVLNSDADEFWWPRGGSLKDVLGAIPARFGVVRGCWRHFLPRPGHDDAFFAERMTVRLAAPAHPGDKRTIYHAHQKVAHRGTPDVWIESGNHNATGEGLEPLRGWHPIEVLHFSLRSATQVERKFGGGEWLRNESFVPPPHLLLADEAYRGGRIDEYFAGFVVGDDALERGLASGTLAIDTRLRDALRALRTDDGRFRVPETGAESVLTFPRPDVPEDAVYAGEASVLAEIDGIVRGAERVDAFERRLESLERGPLGRLRRLASR
jgi:Glycosyl transferase family 2